MPADPRRDPVALEAALAAAHGARDSARLAVLHEAAAGLHPDGPARRFQLTHAWVHALDAGDWTRAGRLEAELRRLGGL